jgi:chromosome segregation protein
MQLRNLTLFGFKSFPDRTALDFERGITAIVGPNGCGKSNIAEAVRWVLGEQSAKALRGGEMADVIFNGTDGRKPLGLAEVSLTIEGVDGEHLKAAGVELAYDEVTLTRRVFRDGGSEYFINGAACRLKDIQQLFMGTGVGRASYSIMGQGNITQLLSSKPEDRRLVFEEAAGITRFKAQKKEALRKLESTEQNLLRLSDLIREVKRQIGSLQRQAGKARRYKQYQRDLQYLETQLARHQFDVLEAEVRERQARVETLRREIEGATETAFREENELARFRERLAELEQAISQSQQRGLELKAELERHQGRIQYNQERQGELAAQHARAVDEIAEAEARRRASALELAGVAQQLNGSLAKVEQQRQCLEQQQAALQSVENRLRQAQEALRQRQDEAFTAAQELSRVRNQISALDLHKQGNVIRLEKLSAEKIQLEEERTRLEARLEEFARQAQTEQQDVEARRLSLEERQQRLRELEGELNRGGQELDDLQQRQAEARSRLGVLEQLESSHEGFAAGALAALGNAQNVVGALTDRMRVPDRYVAAVEAALGHYVQVVLTERPETAHQILADLSANKRGRASIASLALCSASPPPAAVPAELARRAAGLQCTPVLDAVEADASVQPLLRGLLGRTHLAPDLGAATRAWNATNGQFDFVTQAGEMLSRHGVFTGGATDGAPGASASSLSRRNQMAELREQLAALQAQIAEASRRKGTLHSEQTALQAGLQQAQSQLRAQEVALATRQGEFNALQNALRVLHQKVDTVVYEVQSLAAQQREGDARRADLASQLTQLERRDNGLQQQLAALGASLEGLRQQRDAAQAALTEAKVALATEEQVCAALRNQHRPLELRLAELDQLIAQRWTEIESFVRRKAQAEAEIHESQSQVELLGREREQQSREADQLGGQREGLADEIAAREEGLRARRGQLAELQEQRRALDVEVAQRQGSMQNLRERIQQKYQVNLEEVRSECIRITFAAEGPPKVVILTPEEMAAAGVATDWDAVAEQAAALQQRIDEMGPVNLVAIAECEETEQRHQFLSAQHEDLVQAREQLVAVINRVNAQTREMFTATFAQVRENFRALFVEVFGGGKADLYLVDEGDVLESGIEIVARPPGKQLQSISLLSGGEQTMTAVALLFAIYQVKPSPFCVLDELDAPLDEANINRFVRLLQRFLAHSQFVIMTHNKRTIAMADVLYGITMQEQGVSKIVSVRFHKAGELALDHPATPLETPPPIVPLELEADREQKPDETLEVAAAG